MKLGTKGRYAVTAIADIASHAQDRHIPLSEISERQNISSHYLEQLFRKLRNAGIVESMRGPGGGYKLAKPPSQTTVAEIMVAVDERLQATKCSGEVGRGCTSDGTHCLTHNLWERLSAHVHVFLQQTTVEDIIATDIQPCPAVPDFSTLIEQLDSPLERNRLQ